MPADRMSRHEARIASPNRSRSADASPGHGESAIDPLCVGTSLLGARLLAAARLASVIHLDAVGVQTGGTPAETQI